MVCFTRCIKAAAMNAKAIKPCTGSSSGIHHTASHDSTIGATNTVTRKPSPEAFHAVVAAPFLPPGRWSAPGAATAGLAGLEPC